MKAAREAHGRRAIHPEEGGRTASEVTAAAAAAARAEVATVVEDVIRRRRVTRDYLPTKLDRTLLKRLADVALRAPSGGNRRPVRVVVVHDPERLRRVIAVTPGVTGSPPAVLVLCIDWGQAPHLAVDDHRKPHTLHVDLGAALQNALLLAEAEGLGACPVTSFHRPSVRTLLGLPATWTPIVMVALGERRSPPPPPLAGPRPTVHWDMFRPELEEAET